MRVAISLGMQCRTPFPNRCATSNTIHTAARCCACAITRITRRSESFFPHEETRPFQKLSHNARGDVCVIMSYIVEIETRRENGDGRVVLQTSYHGHHHIPFPCILIYDGAGKRVLSIPCRALVHPRLIHLACSHAVDVCTAIKHANACRMTDNHANRQYVVAKLMRRMILRRVRTFLHYATTCTHIRLPEDVRYYLWQCALRRFALCG